MLHLYHGYTYIFKLKHSPDSQIELQTHSMMIINIE